MHVARGAQPELPAVLSATSCRPSVSVVQAFPARGAEILRRKRASINCLASKVRGLRIRPPKGWRGASWPSTSPPERCCRPKLTRALRRCSGGRIICSRSSTVESHVVLGRVQPGACPGPSFGQVVSSRKVSGSQCCAGFNGARWWVPAQSPNTPLQRAGTHKVLGRGRPSVVILRSLARPRASAAAGGR